MRKKTQLKLLLIEEIIKFNTINFDIMDFMYINNAFKYAKSIFTRMVSIF